MGQIGKSNRESVSVFNSPFELGIRMVYLLNAMYPDGADLQKLVLLDYAVVYSADLGGPESLHTPVPFRGGEYLSRRELIEKGLYIMSTRGLVGARLDDSGITYIAGPSARSMVGALESEYLRHLDERCEWAAKKYTLADSGQLTREFAEKGQLWGAELAGIAGRGQLI
ncbi:ABC-three component system middle component 2 [Achromobacter sp. UBA5777]|uniref:ABC-three component system middle component 2 n=1 Tax=Achromobacter sp. UBA5777 TaxID=1945913 RepID=UPI0032E4B9CE